MLFTVSKLNKLADSCRLLYIIFIESPDQVQEELS
jgi:hypothetical protein